MYGKNKYGTAKYGRSAASIFSVLSIDLVNITTNANFSINATIKDILSIYTLFRQTITQVVQDILSISTLPVFQAFLKPPLRAIARLINSVRSTCNIKSDSVKGRVRQPENKGMVK